MPGGSVATWMATLDAALDLGPDHLSLYALTLDDPDAEGLTGPGGDHLPTRAGARRWREAARPEQDEDRAAAQYHHAVVRLETDGWRGYEISNWARPGHESRHNLAYWDRRPYEAVGPGAHAFDGADAALERGSARRLRRGAGPAAVGRSRGCRRAARRRSTATWPPPRRRSSGSASTRACRSRPRTEPPLAAWFGWALAAELLEVTTDDRIVLTTRGRLLSNELFARLV